jgi:hypothetical protein
VSTILCLEVAVTYGYALTSTGLVGFPETLFHTNSGCTSRRYAAYDECAAGWHTHLAIGRRVGGV